MNGMKIPQSTIAEIIQTENYLILNALARYGEFYEYALSSTVFLSNFIKSASRREELFIRFASQVKKHHTLAVFSTVRLHRVQAMMDLRQTLEAGACAAYALRNPDPSHFVDITQNGLLNPSRKLTDKRYKWLDAQFPQGSAAIKERKDQINESMSHANLINTSQNFFAPEGKNLIEAPFFDIEDEFLIKIDLWLSGTIAITLLDLFYGVSQGQSGLVLRDDFQRRHMELANMDDILRRQLLATDRYQDTMRSSATP
jgi:hypothetical protein